MIQIKHILIGGLLAVALLAQGCASPRIVTGDFGVLKAHYYGGGLKLFFNISTAQIAASRQEGAVEFDLSQVDPHRIEQLAVEIGYINDVPTSRYPVRHLDIIDAAVTDGKILVQIPRVNDHSAYLGRVTFWSNNIMYNANTWLVRHDDPSSGPTELSGQPIPLTGPGATMQISKNDVHILVTPHFAEAQHRGYYARFPEYRTIKTSSTY